MRKSSNLSDSSTSSNSFSGRLVQPQAQHHHHHQAAVAHQDEVGRQMMRFSREIRNLQERILHHSPSPPGRPSAGAGAGAVEQQSNGSGPTNPSLASTTTSTSTSNNSVDVTLSPNRVLLQTRMGSEGQGSEPNTANPANQLGDPALSPHTISPSPPKRSLEPSGSSGRSSQGPARSTLLSSPARGHTLSNPLSQSAPSTPQVLDQLIPSVEESEDPATSQAEREASTSTHLPQLPQFSEDPDHPPGAGETSFSRPRAQLGHGSTGILRNASNLSISSSASGGSETDLLRAGGRGASSLGLYPTPIVPQPPGGGPPSATPPSTSLDTVLSAVDRMDVAELRQVTRSLLQASERLLKLVPTTTSMNEPTDGNLSSQRGGLPPVQPVGAVAEGGTPLPGPALLTNSFPVFPAWGTTFISPTHGPSSATQFPIPPGASATGNPSAGARASVHRISVVSANGQVYPFMLPGRSSNISGAPSPHAGGAIPPPLAMTGFMMDSASRRGSEQSAIDFGAVHTADQLILGEAPDGLEMINQLLILDDLVPGKVKLCFDQEKQELRAVKIIRRPSVVGTTVLGEIAIWKKLRHKNIVSLFEVIDDPSSRILYLVMQYVEKGPVVSVEEEPELNCNPGEGGRWARGIRCSTVDPTTLLGYARQICAGLAYLHSKGVAHNDLKPANILLGRDDQVYLADFGVSELLNSEADSTGAAVEPPKAEGLPEFSEDTQQGLVQGEDVVQVPPPLPATARPCTSVGAEPNASAPSADPPEQGNSGSTDATMSSTGQFYRDLIELENNSGPTTTSRRQSTAVTPVSSSIPYGAGLSKQERGERRDSKTSPPVLPIALGDTSVPEDSTKATNFSVARYGVGTPAFFPPEVLDHQLGHTVMAGRTTAAQQFEIAKAGDIWALGVSLYMMLVGFSPFCPVVALRLKGIPSTSNSSQSSTAGAAVGDSPHGTAQAKSSDSLMSSAERSLTTQPNTPQSKTSNRPHPLPVSGHVAVGSPDGKLPTPPEGGVPSVLVGAAPTERRSKTYWEEYKEMVLRGSLWLPTNLPLSWRELLGGMLVKDPTKRWTIEMVRSKVKAMYAQQKLVLESLAEPNGITQGPTSGTTTVSPVLIPLQPPRSTPKHSSIPHFRRLSATSTTTIALRDPDLNTALTALHPTASGLMGVTSPIQRSPKLTPVDGALTPNHGLSPMAGKLKPPCGMGPIHHRRMCPCFSHAPNLAVQTGTTPASSASTTPASAPASGRPSPVNEGIPPPTAQGNPRPHPVDQTPLVAVEE